LNAETHKRITQAVIQRVGLSGPITFIVKGSADPDILPDYEYRPYVTARGRIRYRRVRMTHHGNLDWAKRTATSARHSLLRSEDAPPSSSASVFRKLFRRTREHLLSKAFYQAGRTLHYLQDSVIISPKIDKSVHNQVESSCRYLDPTLYVRNVTTRTPTGKAETYKEIESVKATKEPLKAMVAALKHSYAVLSSIFSSSKVPPRLGELGNYSYKRFKENRKYLLAYLGLLMMIPTALLIKLLSLFVLLTLLPSLYVAYLGIIVTLSKDMNTVLRTATRVDRGVCYIIGGALLTALLLWQLLPLLQILAVILLYLIFFRFPEWNRVKAEIDWFRWSEDGS